MKVVFWYMARTLCFNRVFFLRKCFIFLGDEGQDDSDRDQNFVPPSSDEDKTTTANSTADDDSGDSSSDATVETTKPRKRKKNQEQWKRLQAKKRRNSGLEYVGQKGEAHVAKQVRPYPHSCRYKCNEFSENNRADIFRKFWELGNWNLQISFLHLVLG